MHGTAPFLPLPLLSCEWFVLCALETFYSFPAVNYCINTLKMFRGEDREATWNYFQAGLSMQMLRSLSKLHLSCSLFLTLLNMSLLSMQKEEKLWIYSTLNSQASGDWYSGHKACPTLITVNLPSITGHLRETHKSQITWLSPPGFFPIPCLSLAECTMWLFLCCSTS